LFCFLHRQQGIIQQQAKDEIAHAGIVAAKAMPEMKKRQTFVG
jgi:hypothetical protein